MSVGFMNPEVKTPNLDRLAANGTIFERAYTVNPTCTPTRASLITGQYPSQHGAWSLGTKLPEDVPTIGEHFQKAGYRTALVGKAHFQQLYDHPQYRSIESNPHQQYLKWWRDFNGPFYGFEHVEICRNHADEFHVGQHYAIWMEDNGFSDWKDYYWEPAGNVKPFSQEYSWKLPAEYHYNSWIAERTSALMEDYHKNGDNFMLWASFPDPHPPYLVPEPWASMYDPDSLTIPEITPGEHDNNPPHFAMTQEQKPDFSAWQEPDGSSMHGFHSHLKSRKARAKDLAVYYGMISFMDDCIGQILNKLDQLGMTEDTLVVFTTDHGHFMGQHGLTAKGPFLYEDMIKVPFIVSQPGTVPEGRASDALQSLVDLPVTFLDAAGIEKPRTMTGISQLDVWNGSIDKIRDHVIVENHHQPTTIHQRTYVNERYKITVYYNRPYGELFDLKEDPGEINNLWDNQDSQQLKSELLLKLIHGELGKEPIWMPRVWGA
jgi:arylsulfatase A-like enzyme